MIFMMNQYNIKCLHHSLLSPRPVNIYYNLGEMIYFGDDALDEDTNYEHKLTHIGLK